MLLISVQTLLFLNIYVEGTCGISEVLHSNPARSYLLASLIIIFVYYLLRVRAQFLSFSADPVLGATRYWGIKKKVNE